MEHKPPPAGRRRLRWWFAAVAAGLLAGEAIAKLRSAVPFPLSVLDALVVVALAVVIGTYVILARAERQPARSEEASPPGDEPRA